MNTPLVYAYQSRLNTARWRVWDRMGPLPCLAGEDSESSERNARLRRRRDELVKIARQPLLIDFRHYLRQQYRDLKRRGLSNREGSNNRRWRRYVALERRAS